ncbi:MAG: hypothetical protein ACI9UN_000354 [Granulosicoccus sp.]|jgi:hypothetical protein
MSTRDTIHHRNGGLRRLQRSRLTVWVLADATKIEALIPPDTGERERRIHVNDHWFGSTNIPLSVLTPHINWLMPERDVSIHLLDWQDAPSEAAVRQWPELGFCNRHAL